MLLSILSQLAPSSPLAIFITSVTSVTDTPLSSTVLPMPLPASFLVLLSLRKRRQTQRSVVRKICTGRTGTKRRRTVLAAGADATQTSSMWRAKKVHASLSGLMSRAAGPALRDDTVQFNNANNSLQDITFCTLMEQGHRLQKIFVVMIREGEDMLGTERRFGVLFHGETRTDFILPQALNIIQDRRDNGEIWCTHYGRYSCQEIEGGLAAVAVGVFASSPVFNLNQ